LNEDWHLLKQEATPDHVTIETGGTTGIDSPYLPLGSSASSYHTTLTNILNRYLSSLPLETLAIIPISRREMTKLVWEVCPVVDAEELSRARKISTDSEETLVEAELGKALERVR